MTEHKDVGKKTRNGLRIAKMIAQNRMSDTNAVRPLVHCLYYVFCIRSSSLRLLARLQELWPVSCIKPACLCLFSVFFLLCLCVRSVSLARETVGQSWTITLGTLVDYSDRQYQVSSNFVSTVHGTRYIIQWRSKGETQICRRRETEMRSINSHLLRIQQTL